MNEASALSTILTNIGTFITSAFSWVGTAVSAITASGNEIIFISAAVGLVGLGIGLARRMLKLRV